MVQEHYGRTFLFRLVDRQPKSWSDENRWLMQELKRKGWRRSLLKLALTETIYTTLIARNAICFRKEIHIDIEKEIKYNIVHRGSLNRIVNTHIDKQTCLYGTCLVVDGVDVPVSNWDRFVTHYFWFNKVSLFQKNCYE